MANGHGGKRLGAGRKRNGDADKLLHPTPKKDPERLEDAIVKVLCNDPARAPENDIKQLTHRLAYVEQELAFIKKIIVASATGGRK